MTELRITRLGPGVARVTTVDPFDNLEILRIERSSWKETPKAPGVYLLYGFPKGEPTAYVGMSTTDMRARINSHNVQKGDWFGVLFVIRLPNAVLAQAVEAELIGLAREADVVGLTNKASEKHFADTNLGEVGPAVTKITAALEMILGTDIFTPTEAGETETVVNTPVRPAKLARVYGGPAKHPRPRTSEDLPSATHALVRPALGAWGRFEADEPDKRFRVLATSRWRSVKVDPSAVTAPAQQSAADRQKHLIQAGTLDPETCVFLEDHVFDNWTQAVICVTGTATYSGTWHWQRLMPPA